MKRKPEEYLDSDKYILRSGEAERIKQPADYTALLALILIAAAVIMAPSALINLLSGAQARKQYK